MDKTKLQEIIENSNLSEEAKGLILDMLPEADKPEIQEEIMKAIDYEIKMYGLAVDEFDEVRDQINTAEMKADAADTMEDERLDELSKKYQEKMGVAEEDIKQQLQYKDNLIKAVSEKEVEAQQSPGYGGQQYNSAPTTQASYPPVPTLENQS